jgi:tRNA1(Val) A37 N6-methylase TrmN6
MTTPEPDATQDAFFDGAFHVLQPRRGGHRAGLDALLLAAAIPSDASGHLVDLGAGAGVAGLAACTRLHGLTATLVERDSLMAGLARSGRDLPENAALAERVSVVETDVTAPEAERLAAGLHPAAADWVIANPPFHPGDAARGSPHDRRRAAHVIEAGSLDRWIRCALWLLKPKGRLALIYRADGLAEVLTLMQGRFGALSMMPIHPHAGEAALRIVVTGVKGSRAPLRILPGLVLHGDDQAYLPQVDAILRGRAGLIGD